jgi:glycosyltransferase involved in cell wall biosynthesis
MRNSTSIGNPHAEMQSSSDLLKTIVSYSNCEEDAAAVIRLFGPARQLGLRVIQGVEQGKVQIDAVLNGDIIIIQRDFCRDLDSYEQILSLAHTQKKPVVFDLDDLIFELPENHTDRISSFYADALLPMLQAIMEVDLVTVATPSLRDYCLPYNENVVVIPNYLNDSLWIFKEPSNSTPSSGKVTIGYMGGHTHKPDLILVLPALERIVKKYPQKVQFQFWGIEPPPELAPFSRVDWCPPKSSKYTDFVSYFQTQTADIMMAPLCDNLFNSCKSPIKYLEYSAIAVPGVYSRVAPYSSMIEEGVDGFLASSASEWEVSLSKLIEDQDLRRRIAHNAQQKIKQHWLLSQNAEKQMQIYIDAVSNYGELKHPFPSFYSIEKSLTRQIFDEQHHKNQQIKLLLDQLNEREKEALFYAQSKNRRFTWPFRKISQRIKKGFR